MDKRLQDAYYHGTKKLDLFRLLEVLDESFENLIKIIESRYILSIANQNISKKEEEISLCGKDSIAICKDLRNEINEYADFLKDMQDAYSTFVLDNFSIIIKSDIDGVYKPKLYRSYLEAKANNLHDGKNEGTDLFDEWRVKDKISLEEYCIGIGLPTLARYGFFFSKGYSKVRIYDLYSKYYEEIINKLYSSNLDFPLFDTELKEEIQDINLEYIEKLEEYNETRERIKRNI